MIADEHGKCTFELDSIDMWPLLSGQNKTAPRTELMLGIMLGGSLIVENLKYIEGVQGPDWWYRRREESRHNGHDPSIS